MSTPIWLQKLESSVATTEKVMFSPILGNDVQSYSIFLRKKLLSQTIKLVKGGLKNLTERTEDTVNNINITNDNLTNLNVLDAKFLLTNTKYSLYCCTFFSSI